MTIDRCWWGLLTASLLLTPLAAGEASGGSGGEAAAAGQPIVTAYPSIQAAVDAHPGQIVYVPAGDYPLQEPIRIRHAQLRALRPRTTGPVQSGCRRH